MERVVAFTGPPSALDITSMHSEFGEIMIANLTYNQPRIILRQRLPMADADTIDFIEKLLVFNPDRRMSAATALEHPFLAQFHDAEEEIVANEPLTIGLRDDRRYPVQEYRNQIYRNLITRN
jgi:serine/threonine protein kinase